MGSFVALHIRARDTDSLVAPVSAWLESHGFGASVRLESAPSSLQRFKIRADVVGLGKLNDDWGVLVFNGFNLGARFIDADVVRPLAERVTSRFVLFAGQTTSEAYQIVVFDGSRCVRHIVVTDGECQTNEGPRLPGERAGAFSSEAATEGDDDDSPSALEDAAAVCSAMGFELWSTPPWTGAIHVWRRRGLFSRLLGR